MAKPWSAVETSPEYLALPHEEKLAASEEYFNSVVAPKVPPAELETVKQKFKDRTRLDSGVLASGGRSLANAAVDTTGTMLHGVAAMETSAANIGYGNVGRVMRKAREVMDVIDSTPSISDEDVEKTMQDFGVSNYRTDRMGSRQAGTGTAEVLSYLAAKRAGDEATAQTLRSEAQAQSDKADEIIPTRERAPYGAGTAVKQFADEAIPVTPEESERWYNKYLTNPVGSTVPFLAGSMATGGLGAPAALATTTITGAAAGAGQSYDQAIQEGATEEQAQNTVPYGIGGGALEALPIAGHVGKRFLNPLDDSFQKLVREQGYRAAAGNMGKSMLLGGVEEGAQEATQQVVQNYGAQQTYAPDKPITEGLVDNAAGGAGAGAALAAIGAFIPGRTHNVSAPPNQPFTPGAPIPEDATPPAPPPAGAATSLLQDRSAIATPNVAPQVDLPETNGLGAPYTPPPPDAMAPPAAQATSFPQDTQVPGEPLRITIPALPSNPPPPSQEQLNAELKDVFNSDKPIEQIIDERDFPDKLPEETLIQVDDGEGTEPTGFAYYNEKTKKTRMPGEAVTPPAPPVAELGRQWQDVTPDVQLPAGAQTITDAGTGTTRARMTTSNTPVPVESREDVEAAATRAASHPDNGLPEPTEAQKEAGNYLKGHVSLQGLNISIETPRGGERKGTSPGGEPWSVTMPSHYGYIKKTDGADGEQVDAFIGDNPSAKGVWVIDQVEPDTKKFDEHKVMVGFNSPHAAVEAYTNAFNDGKGRERIGAFTKMSMPEFKEWLKGDTTKPLGQITTPSRKEVVSNVRSAEVLDNGGAAVGTPPAAAPTAETPPGFARTFKMVDDAIASRDAAALNNILGNLSNKNARAYFEKQTGVKLPPRVGKTKEVIEKWQKNGIDSLPAPAQAETSKPSYTVTKADIIPTRSGVVAVPITEEPDYAKSDEPAQNAADETKPIGDLHQYLESRISEGRTWPSIAQLRREAGQYLGSAVLPNTETAKQVDEQTEIAYTIAARKIADESSDVDTVYDKLVKLYNAQPALAQRSSTSVEQQAYSTPAPIAYLASRLAGINKQTTILEPAAGHGGLVIGADPRNVTAIEINNNRAKALERILPDANIENTNYMYWSGNASSRRYDVVITNPPFGKIPNKKSHPIGGGWTEEIDQAVSLMALSRLRADKGRGVLIIGSKRGLNKNPEGIRDAYNTANSRLFFKHLYDNYNVTDHFSVDGGLYKKQGAGYPIDIIVIGGHGKSSLPLPGVKAPRLYSSFDQLKELLYDNTSRNVHVEEQPQAGVRDSNEPEGRDDGARVPARGDGANPVVDRPRGGQGASAENNTGGAEIDGAGKSTVPAGKSRPLGERPAAAPADERVAESGGAGQSDSVSAPKSERVEREPAAGRIERPAAASSERPHVKVAEETVSESGLQVSYNPTSKAQSLETLIPVKMRAAVKRALSKIEDEVGDIDMFVAKELGYSGNEELYKVLGAEQIEAVAMAIRNIQNRSGFIIGDQTGIGKGRVNAAILRYARLKGKVPVFITKDPALYADMYRDLHAIGERNFKALITNTGGDLRGEKAMFVEETGDTISSLTPAPYRDAFNHIITKGELPKGYDYLFTTYPQMTIIKGKAEPRHRALEQIAGQSVMSLDESHLAGGQGQGAFKLKKKGDNDVAVPEQYESRAKFIRHLVDMSPAVMYSSATYAKNPDVMDLYRKTDIRLAVEKMSDLSETIRKGGVPLQQVIANMLVDAGQYVRREKSYDGIKMDMSELKVDHATADRVANALYRIFQFDTTLDEVRGKLKEDVKEEAGAFARDNAVSMAGLSSTNFSSVMHNIVAQSLMAAKIGEVVKMAKAMHSNGKKVVIAVVNTNEAILTDFMEQNELKVGDTADGLSFNTLFQRYLERTRRMLEKDSEGNKKVRIITEGEMGAANTATYKELMKELGEEDFGGAPVSPIDYLLAEFKKAGMKAGEVTGRGTILTYTPDGHQLIESRDASNSNKKKTISKFNGGELDVVILNESGSTGVSMHSSKAFKDQKPRSMIILQAAPNIDTYMQMLGRTNRTGQVNLPDYNIVVSDIPVERRPAAVLMKKLASLNANTTANKRGATTIDSVVDFMNPYGDALINEMLADEPELRRALDMSLAADEENAEGMASKLTGRLAILPVKEQARVLDMIEERYKTLMQYLDNTGQNSLEAKELDLKAITTGEIEVSPSTGDSPFTAPVVLEQVSVKKIGKPYTPEQVKGKIDETLGGKTPAQHAAALEKEYNEDTEEEWKRIEQRWKNAQAEEKDVEKARTRHETAKALREIITDFLDTYRVGQNVMLKSDEGNLHGIIIDISRDQSSSPVAVGQFTIKIAMADASREISIPLSQAVKRPGASVEPKYELAMSHMTNERMKEEFETGSREVRLQRYMITGNLFKGFDQFKQGKITFYTKENGSVGQGILMPSSFDPKEELSKLSVKLNSPAEAAALLKEVRDGRIVTQDGLVTVERDYVNPGQYKISVKRTGGKVYYTSKAVREALGQDLFSRSGDFTQTFPPEKLPSVYKGVEIAGGSWAVKQNQDFIRSLRGEKEVIAKFQAPKSGARAMPGVARVTEVKGDLSAQERDVVDKLMAITKERFGKDVDVKIFQKISDDEGSSHLGAFMNLGGRNVIGIARETLKGKPEATLNHEGIHFLRATGAISENEWKVLSNKARSSWIKDYNIEARYRDKSLTPAQQQLLNEEEAIAEAHADIKKWKAYPKVVRDIFAKISDFINAVREFLGANPTADKILRDISAGKYADKAAVAKAPDGVKFQRGDKKTSKEPMSLAISDEGIRDVITDGNLTLMEKIKTASKKDTIRASIDHWRRFMQDRFIHWVRVQNKIEEITGKPLGERQDVYGAEELYSGRVGFKLDELEAKHKEPLIQKIADFNNKHGDGIEKVEKFLYAMHAEERNAQIAKINPKFPNDGTTGSGGSGMDAEEIAEIKKQARADGTYDEMMDIAKGVHAMLEEALRLRLESGLITKEYYDTLREAYKNYVPLKGLSEMGMETEGLGIKTGKGLDVRGKEFIKARGRGSKASDLLAHSFAAAEEAIIRGEKNRVEQTLYNLVQKYPSDMWETAAPALKPVLNQATGLIEYRALPMPKNAKMNDFTIGVKIDGVQKLITVKDKRLIEPLKNLNIAQMHGVLKMMMIYGRILSQVNTTLNPEFIVTNALRDLETAMVNLGQYDLKKFRREVLRDYPKALRGAWGALRGKEGTEMQNWFREYSAAGGKVNFFMLDDINARRLKLNRELKMRGEGALPLTRRGARAVMQLVEDANGAVENAIRLSVFVNLRRRGKSPSEAARVAKNLTVNFNKRGEWATQMNAMYLFYNASVQSAFVILNALRSRSVQKIAGSIVMFGLLGSLLNSLLSPEDDDGELIYDKIPEYEKEANIILVDPTGQLSKIVDGMFVIGTVKGVKYIKIPMAYGYRSFHELGRTTGDVLGGRETIPGAMANVIHSVVNNFNPIGGDESILNFFAPTILDPAVNIKMNRTFSGSKIQPEVNQFDKSPPPASERYFPNVSDASRVITRELNSLTGGDKVKEGAISVSPEVLDYMFSQFTGGAGAFVGRTVDVAAKAAAGEDIAIGDIPFARQLFGGKRAWLDKSAAYDRMSKIEEIEGHLKSYADTGDQKKVAEEAAENKNLLALAGTIRATKKSLSGIRKAKIAVENSDLPAADKKKRLADMDATENQIVTNFNRQYLEATKKDQDRED